MSKRSDLDFVADIVAGQSSTQATRTQRRAQQRQQRDEQPPLPQQPPPNEAPSTSSASPYNTPSSSSTARLLHCEACDCWVPNKPDTWQVHIAGIRHQRQLLSYRMHGERGKLVISTFESLPGPRDPTHRLVGKAASDFGLRNTNPGPALSTDQRKMLEEVEIAVRSAVVNLWGSANPTFKRVMENFETRFSNALLQAQNTLQGRRRRTGTPTLAVSSLGEYPLDVAVMAYLLPQHTEPILHLDIDMLPYDCSRTSQVQSWLTSVFLLLDTIAKHPHLSPTRITLREGGLRPDIVPWEVSAYYQGWRRALSLLHTIIESPRHNVKHLTLHMQDFEDSSEAQLQEILYNNKQSLVTAAKEKVVALRTSLLLGWHSRAGRCSMLQVLPLPVMRIILDEAVPVEGCQVDLDIQLVPDPNNYDDEEETTDEDDDDEEEQEDDEYDMADSDNDASDF